MQIIDYNDNDSNKLIEDIYYIFNIYIIYEFMWINYRLLFVTTSIVEITLLFLVFIIWCVIICIMS
jgi:hypothetical protein